MICKLLKRIHFDKIKLFKLVFIKFLIRNKVCDGLINLS